MLKVTCVVLNLLLISYAAEIKSEDDEPLPPGVITCQIDNNPHRDECIKESIQDLLPKLTNGMSSLHIPPIDPYFIEETEIDFKQAPVIFGSGVGKNIRIYGASQATIHSLKTDITKTDIEAEFKVSLPLTLVEGFYKGEGRFNTFKLKSKGYFNATATDITSIFKIKGKFEQIKGNVYLRITDVDLDPKFSNIKLFASGLFPDPELNRVMLELVNQYLPLINKEIIDDTKNVWEPLLLKEANKFLLNVPVNKILYYSQDSA